SLILTIKNCGTVTLKDKSKAYYLERPGFSGKILKESVDNSFTVNTKGLEPGYYTLVLPAGTFKYDYPGYYVLDEEMSVSFSTIPLSIVGISSTEDDGIYYDLSGRKVNAPTKKGIYIKNGRKVVVK
ncbi:MAG: hypothetical protein IKX61_04860, partial [Prevotella sp.]|nr:hypothetical protein [Prevotella sp.]